MELWDNFALRAEPMGADEVFVLPYHPVIQSFWPWNPFYSFQVTNLGTGDSLAIAGSSRGAGSATTDLLIYSSIGIRRADCNLSIKVVRIIDIACGITLSGSVLTVADLLHGWRECLCLQLRWCLDNGGSQASFDVPFHMAMDDPDSWVVCYESDHCVARRGKCPGISADGCAWERGRVTIVDCLRGDVSIFDHATDSGHELGGMAVCVYDVSACIIVVDDD